MEHKLTLGSLFDGSGGFPLAGLCGPICQAQGCLVAFLTPGLAGLGQLLRLIAVLPLRQLQLLQLLLHPLGVGVVAPAGIAAAGDLVLALPQLEQFLVHFMYSRVA